MEIWTGVTDALLTDSLTTLKDSATQLLIEYKSGALVTQRAQWNQNKVSLVRLLRHLGGDLDRDLLDPFQVGVQAPHCEVLLV